MNRSSDEVELGATVNSTNADLYQEGEGSNPYFTTGGSSSSLLQQSVDDFVEAAEAEAAPDTWSLEAYVPARSTLVDWLKDGPRLLEEKTFFGYKSKEVEFEFERFYLRDQIALPTSLVYVGSFLSQVIRRRTDSGLSTTGWDIPYWGLCALIALIALGVDQYSFIKMDRYSAKRTKLRKGAHIILGLCGLLTQSWIIQYYNARVCFIDETPENRRRICTENNNPIHMVLFFGAYMYLFKLKLSYQYSFSVLVLLVHWVIWSILGGEIFTNGTRHVIIYLLEHAVFFTQCILIATYRYRSQQRQFELSIGLVIARQKAVERQAIVDTLLEALVPADVLPRLLDSECSDITMRQVDYAFQASVLFSDVAGFTAWSSSRTAAQVVSMLNVLVTEFDEVAKTVEIERIKTIGDAYWAVCGIPKSCEDHAIRLCNFAKAMLHIVKRSNAEHPEWTTSTSSPSNNSSSGIQLRIGIHTGQVNGAILGSKQIAWEVFGETNDIAGLAEQHGEPGYLAITGATLNSIQQLENEQERSGVDGGVGGSSSLIQTTVFPSTGSRVKELPTHPQTTKLFLVAREGEGNNSNKKEKTSSNSNLYAGGDGKLFEESVKIADSWRGGSGMRSQRAAANDGTSISINPLTSFGRGGSMPDAAEKKKLLKEKRRVRLFLKNLRQKRESIAVKSHHAASNTDWRAGRSGASSAPGGTGATSRSLIPPLFGVAASSSQQSSPANHDNALTKTVPSSVNGDYGNHIESSRSNNNTSVGFVMSPINGDDDESDGIGENPSSYGGSSVISAWDLQAAKIETRRFSCCCQGAADQEVETRYERFTLDQTGKARFVSRCTSFAALIVFAISLFVDGRSVPGIVNLLFILAPLLMIGPMIINGYFACKYPLVDLLLTIIPFTLLQIGVLRGATAAAEDPASVNMMVASPVLYAAAGYIPLASSTHTPWSSGPTSILGLSLLWLPSCFIEVATTPTGPSNAIVLSTVIAINIFFFCYVNEKTMRRAFYEDQKSQYASRDREERVRETEDVLLKLVPEHITSALMKWIGEGMSTDHSVSKEYDQICIAFISLNPLLKRTRSEKNTEKHQQQQEGDDHHPAAEQAPHTTMRILGPPLIDVPQEQDLVEKFSVSGGGSINDNNNNSALSHGDDDHQSSHLSSSGGGGQSSNSSFYNDFNAVDPKTLLKRGEENSPQQTTTTMPSAQQHLQQFSGGGFEEDGGDWLLQAHRTIDGLLERAASSPRGGGKRGSRLTKIKTVGDLLMIAGPFSAEEQGDGASGSSFSHHEEDREVEKAGYELVELAMQIGDEAKKLKLEAVTGMHVGPVMTAILGVSRPMFDVFGDTVNTASRVMSCTKKKERAPLTSVCACSGEFADLLRQGGKRSTTIPPLLFDLGEAEEVTAKGKGIIQVHQLSRGGGATGVSPSNQH